MRWLLLLSLWLWPVSGLAQSDTVAPDDLELRIEVEAADHVPFPREMVLITIRGTYRRHITLEKLVQPDLDGFSWTQLGNDIWLDERVDGEQVKTFRRRMALYPDHAGTLTIGAFAHQLTLTDARAGWFEHTIHSRPVTIEVAAAPDAEWWFPVRSLKVSDQWSNAPDQLAPGEGVLRVVRIEALGATPEMIPPMPVLTSPSAIIFAHPEKRFVDLSPEGPRSYAFWRWTIQPGNDTSTIVEPLVFDYFDTVNRISRKVTISAQRIAYGSVVPGAPVELTRVSPTRLPGLWAVPLGLAVIAGGVAFALQGFRVTGWDALRRFAPLDPLARRMRRAAAAGQGAVLRRHAAAMMRRDGLSAVRLALLNRLDRSLFDPGAPPESLRQIARAFSRAS